ncbi:MAG: YdbH domain-containing protein [Desulfobacterales bacterium]|jgi:hypothetical protein
MPVRRNITLPIIFILLVILIGGGLFFLAAYLLPGLFESKLISILKKDAGISEFSLDFRQMDLEGADLGPLRLGPPENPALIVRSVQVDYAAGELYRKKIRKIAASGVELYVEHRNGRWGLRGFDIKQLLRQLNARPVKDSTAKNDTLPFPDHIAINNGILIWEREEITYRLAFEVDVVPQESADHILVATIHLYPRGLPVNVVAHIDLTQNQIRSEFGAENFELLRFADVFQRIDGMTLSGTASLAADARVSLEPFEVSSFNGRLEGSALGIVYKGLRLQPPSGDTLQSPPLAVDFESHKPGKIDIRLSNLVLHSPVKGRLSDFAATVQSTETGTEFSGNFNLAADAANDPAMAAAGLRFMHPFSLPLKFSGHLAGDHQWRFELVSEDRKAPAQNQMAFQYHQNRISAQIPSVHISARGAGRLFDMTYKLQAAAVRIASESVNILSPRLVLTGETNVNADTAHGGISTFDVDLSGSIIKAASATVRSKRLRLGGRLVRDQQGKQGISGRLKFADTRFEGNPANVVLHGVQGSIPFKFPAATSGQKGMISIKNTRFNQLDFGSVQAEVRQTSSGLAFSGIMDNPNLPALVVQFSGTSDFKHTDGLQTRARFTISYPPTAPEIDLGKFLPAAQGFSFSGKLWEQGDIVIGKNGLQATAKTGVQNGSLRHRRNQIAVTGIQTELLIQDLVNVRSAPGQKLKFARASFGDIIIDDGEIDFQIESAQSFLIEKSHFMWSDGKVDAPAIRFKPGIDDYQLILYCDRLNLAKVLEQFGAASVEAQGELNGRIPIQIKNGQLSFKDGFLFTTPGQPGKIRMKDTEILTAGIPKDSPQYVQMELARKALEDYDYTWAKLNLNTEGEDLILSMQLDGKPAQSLPFVYQKDVGGFARVEAGVQGSTFQGIRLDVNFRLPLNKILQYQELIQMIQKSREP